jgi:HAMP domain-containing protein
LKLAKAFQGRRTSKSFSRAIQNALGDVYFTIGGKRQFVRVLPFQDSRGLDWLIVVIVPEADFMEQINAHNRTTILLCLTALMLAIVIATLTAQWIAQPILRLNLAAKNIAKGEWDQTVDIERSDELGELGKSFNSMAAQLQVSFDQMKALNEALSESERRLAQFLEAMPVGVAVLEANGQFYLYEGVWGSYSATSIPGGLGVDTWTPPSQL